MNDRAAIRGRVRKVRVERGAKERERTFCCAASGKGWTTIMKGEKRYYQEGEGLRKRERTYGLERSSTLARVPERSKGSEMEIDRDRRTNTEYA
jgi:ribosomal protein S24E